MCNLNTEKNIKINNRQIPAFCSTIHQKQFPRKPQNAF